MRLQYAVICHEFQDGEWEGVTNLLGVRHKLYGPYNASGQASEPDSTTPKPPIPIKLVISLIDGRPGVHTVWVTVRRPDGQVATAAPHLKIDWDEASPTFFAIYDVNFQVFENGTYDFNILVDGEPIGTTPLPVEVYPVPL